MTRDELITRTRQLIAEGERLEAQPSLGALQLWLQLSDDLLATAWGSMDRYHLAWLMVGKPKDIVRGRPMTADEEAAYVREVAEPEDGRAADEPRCGRTPGDAVRRRDGRHRPGSAEARPVDRAPDRAGLPGDPGLPERLATPRAATPTPIATTTSPRAPRPDRMQR